MMRSAQNEDRDYEVRLNSFSDGTAKFHGYRVPKEEASTKPAPVVRVEPEPRSSFETDGPSRGDPDSTTRQMINAGYSAFANFKK